jgi:DNA-binding NtrC family response regulator
MAKEKVLLVDDEIDFTEVLSERMESRGLEVDVATSGPAALEKAHGKSYDAIILDMAMPEMDGIETLKRLLADNPDLQVILLTGRATVKQGIEAMKIGAMDLLEKPAELERLLEKIEQATTNRMLLVEKRTEEKIKEILETKWW